MRSDDVRMSQDVPYSLRNVSGSLRMSLDNLRVSAAVSGPPGSFGRYPKQSWDVSCHLGDVPDPSVGVPTITVL